VLRDGASAIYGSDAIGGVVNTILRKTYDRFDVNARYAFAADGGSPRETTFTLSGGRVFNEGRTNFTLVYNYYHRDLLMAPERDYAGNADKRPLVDAPFNTNNSFNGLNSSAPFGRFTAVTDAGASVSVPGVSATNGQFYYDPVTGARTTGAGPTGFYNSQAGTQLLPRITRHNLLGAVEHRFNPALVGFGEFSYYRSDSFGQFDASPISLATDGIVIPKTNYYNPAGTRFQGPGTANPAGTPRNVSIRNYRPTEIGPRSYDTESDSYRLLGGLRGTLTNTTWTWESAALFMHGATYQENHGYISASRFLQQLALSTPDAYNPFGGPNDASVYNNFVIDIWDRGSGSLGSVDAKASGEVFTLPGGAVSLAVGGEFRHESMKQRNDPFGLADDVIAQSEQLDVTASRDVYAGFSEVLVPLIGKDNKVPLVRALELRLAARYESYKNFSATKPGVGLSWRPTDWLLLRASYNEGFRAPTIVELFTPAIGRRNDGIVDTARAGQPDALGSVSKRIVTGGNPNLSPEESESWNYGVVVDVPFVKGLSFGADVYRIRQFNQIDNSSATDELDLDNALWDAGGGSNPRVIREARTAADIAANLPGVLIEVLSTFQNLSLREVEGTDFFANYRTPRWSFGRFNFTGSLSYVDELRSIDEDGNATELVQANGNPRIKAAAGVSWNKGAWSASVFERYTGEYNGPASLTSSGQPFIIGAYRVTNASVGYAFRRGTLDGLRLRVGVNNVFDEPPPLYPANSSGYHPSYADPRGRMPYVDVSYKF
jgi:iron complex outermembrane receptor protein